MITVKGKMRKEQRLKFEKKIRWLQDWADVQNISIMCGEAWRTQNTAIAYAKAKLGIVGSKHCHGIARDLWIMDENGNPIFNFEKEDSSQADFLYKKLADQWVNQGETAGYYFKNRFDPFHFELKEEAVK